MSVFGIVILVICAFIGTIVFILRPLDELIKWSKGKTQKEMTEAIQSDDKEKKPPTSGGFVLFYIFINFLFGFIIEPIFIITAIVNKIGYQLFALIALGIMIASWFYTIIGCSRTKKKQKNKNDQIIKQTNPVISWFFRICFFLPELYLWYLFLVVINVL